MPHFSLVLQRGQPLLYVFLAILRRTFGLNHIQDAWFCILAAGIDRVTCRGAVARYQNRETVIRFGVAGESGGMRLKPPNGQVRLIGIRTRRPVSYVPRHHEPIDFPIHSPTVDFTEPLAAMSRCSLLGAMLLRGVLFRLERIG